MFHSPHFQLNPWQLHIHLILFAEYLIWQHKPCIHVYSLNIKKAANADKILDIRLQGFKYSSVGFFKLF